MGRLIKNHLGRLIILTAAAYQVGAAIEGFIWPKIFWDFLTKNLDPAVKPIPILQNNQPHLWTGYACPGVAIELCRRVKPSSVTGVPACGPPPDGTHVHLDVSVHQPGNLLRHWNGCIFCGIQRGRDDLRQALDSTTKRHGRARIARVNDNVGAESFRA
ncbi:hypothetical protein J3459_018185 [Metarhizium acridum]|nr:hypothetical protein J3459_018185 [Metarhizium acridum]